MKVLYDHQVFSIQKYGGASKYFIEIIKRLNDNEWDTSILFSNNEYLKNFYLIKYHQLLPNKEFRGLTRILNEINKPYSIYKILKGNFDIFHQTHFETYSFPFIKKKPMVTTFHDMNFSKYNYEKIVNNQKKSVSRADKIIAISQFTKNELMEFWKVPSDKIDVVYHGVDTPLDKNKIGERIVKEPYIIYVGVRHTFKNFDRLASAFSIIRSKYPDLKLVCTSNSFSKDEIRLFAELNISKNILHASANEIQMANLYSNAEFFIYPSFSEGFGMPILEAMSYGCPTLIANSSCFPEIAGESSLYFDPFDVESIASKMVEILENNELRNSKVESGYALCKSFSWEKSVEGHKKVYNSLL